MAAWDRIERWLEVHAPKVRRGLRPPADRIALMRLERALGQALTGDLAASLCRFDGQDPMAWPALGLFELLGCEDILVVWQDLAPLDRGHDPEVTAHGPVRRQRFHRGWIPVARDPGGDLLFVDTSPPPRGRRGQVLLVSPGVGTVSVVANDWESWLSDHATSLETGRWAVNPLLGRLYPA